MSRKQPRKVAMKVTKKGKATAGLAVRPTLRDITPAPKSVKLRPCYDPTTQTVEVYFKDEGSYRESLTREITLLRSIATQDIIGVQIHGVTYCGGIRETAT